MTAQTRPDELIRILRAEFVTKSGSVPGGGAGTCVAFTCGAIGWRGVGGTTPRTLIHEAAFQLDSYGNTRGNYAIDLQQKSYDYPAVDQVAGSYGSAIYSTGENRIGGTGGNDYDCEWSTITGAWVDIAPDTPGGYAGYCHALGAFSDIRSGCYSTYALGYSHNLLESQYCTATYDDITMDDAFGCHSFGELNQMIRGVDDYPTYCVQFGVANKMENDIFDCYQFGEENIMYNATRTLGGNWQCMQMGYLNYMANVYNCYQFGQYLKSYETTADGFFAGRIQIGEAGYSSVIDGTFHSGGYNQSSWFSQSTSVLLTWPAAWTTYYQYPLIQDSAWGFIAYITQQKNAGASIESWKIEGLIKNAGGTTTLVWSNTTIIHRDDTNKEWQVVADNVNNRLAFQLRDLTTPSSDYRNIQIRLYTEEVGYR